VDLRRLPLSLLGLGSLRLVNRDSVRSLHLPLVEHLHLLSQIPVQQALLELPNRLDRLPQHNRLAAQRLDRRLLLIRWMRLAVGSAHLPVVAPLHLVPAVLLPLIHLANLKRRLDQTLSMHHLLQPLEDQRRPWLIHLDNPLQVHNSRTHSTHPVHSVKVHLVNHLNPPIPSASQQQQVSPVDLVLWV
jgi:hypothetical protein